MLPVEGDDLHREHVTKRGNGASRRIVHIRTRQGDPEDRGRIYVTYTKLNKSTHRYYAGRTSMVIDLTKSLEEQAWLAVVLRDANHHLDEDAEPKGATFSFGRVDVFDVGSAIDYSKRYDDVAYWRIRGREQPLIDSLGGAWSDTRKPYRTENAVRGVAKDNPWGRRFHDAATGRWGPRSLTQGIGNGANAEILQARDVFENPPRGRLFRLREGADANA